MLSYEQEVLCIPAGEAAQEPFRQLVPEPGFTEAGRREGICGMIGNQEIEKGLGGGKKTTTAAEDGN